MLRAESALKLLDGLAPPTIQLQRRAIPKHAAPTKSAPLARFSRRRNSAATSVGSVMFFSFLNKALGLLHSAPKFDRRQ
jgi:hypothetical protein